MNPTADITTTTNQWLAYSWQDLVLRDNRFFTEIMKRVEKWDGAQMVFPFKYQKGNPTVAFNGFDLLPITQVQQAVNLIFFPTFTATNVALAGTSISVNQTPMQTIDLMKVTMQSRAQDGADDIGNFFQGDGSDYSGKAPMGLAGIVDNGSTLASYGGLSRATYAGLNATLNAASNGQISLLQIRQLWNAISDGPVAPNLVISDYDTWAYIEQILIAIQRNTYTDADVTKGEAGFADILWQGMRIMRDKKIPTGTLYMINTSVTKFYGLSWYKGTKISPKGSLLKTNVYEYSEYDPTVFTWTGFIHALNQATINGFMIMGGNLLCLAPFRNGAITGITGN